jgi:tetratricopeptide (TPR) repeat protein
MPDSREEFLDRIDTSLTQVETPSLADEQRSDAERWLRTYLLSKDDSLPETSALGQAGLTLIEALVENTTKDEVKRGLISVGGALAQSLAADGELPETTPAGEWAGLVREFLAFHEEEVLEQAQEAAADRSGLQRLLPKISEGDPKAWQRWLGAYIRDLGFRREIEAANTLLLLYIDARIETALQDDDHETAVQLTDWALQRSAQLDDSVLPARYLNTKGEALADLGRLEEALTAFEAALDRWLDLEAQEPDRYTETVTLVYHQRGIVLRDLGRTKEALEAFDEAHERYLQMEEHASEGYADQIAHVYANRGTALSNLGWPEKALTAYEEALERWVSLDRHAPGRYADEIGKVCANRGNMFSALGRLQKANAAYDRALRRLKPIEKHAPVTSVEEIATVYINRADVLKEVGRLEEALGAYDEGLGFLLALEEKKPERYAEVVATVYENRSDALEDLDRLEAAQTAHEKALQRHRTLEARND